MMEAKRIAHQRRIDGGKSALDRNRDGQFATPYLLGVEIVRLVKKLWPDGIPVEFLEPCVGTGSFYSSLRSVFPEISRAVGIEKDPAFAAAALELWDGSGLEVTNADFTQQSPPDRGFSLIVTNPPYVRHHHLSVSEKARLRAKVLKATGVSLSGLSGLYCYFMLLAHDWLQDGGLSTWLIPSEFLDVNYGRGVKEYLTSQVNLVQIHRFNASDVRFADALVTSAVVVFRKGKPDGGDVIFSQGGELTDPEFAAHIGQKSLDPDAKWGPYFAPEQIDEKCLLRFGDLFSIKRGVATGSNEFFILPESRAKALGIPAEFLRPILPSPRALPDDIVKARNDGYPDLEDPGVLLDCRLKPDQVRKDHPKLWDYIEKGMADKLHEGYLTSRRTPWYSQEDRPAPLFLCTYMGRTKSNGDGPFRFIWNQSKATAHNVYLLLYPKGELKAALARKPALAADVYAALRGLDPAALTGGGRVYGGGLHKVEPKELANIPADFIVTALNGELKSQSTLFD